jgi:predicted nucleotidyltransferase
MNQLKIEKEIVSKLKPIKPVKIIFFGSYAYGNPDKISDLDICVIINSPDKKSEKKKIIRSLLCKIPVAKDILTPSADEFNFYKNEFGSVYMEIDKKGKVIWPNS